MDNSRLKDAIILYVEDDSSVVEAMKSFFDFRVKKVYIARDGVEGLEMFQSYQDEIDVVIADIQMPRMNGIEMIQKIKQVDPKMRFVVTTAYDDSEYVLSCIELGVDAYLTKPIDLKKLRTTVTEQLILIDHDKELLIKQSALNLALQMYDTPAFAFAQDLLIYANSDFLNLFGVECARDIDHELKSHLIEQAKNGHNIVVEGKVFQVKLDEDSLGTICIASLLAS